MGGCHARRGYGCHLSWKLDLRPVSNRFWAVCCVIESVRFGFLEGLRNQYTFLLNNPIILINTRREIQMQVSPRLCNGRIPG